MDNPPPCLFVPDWSVYDAVIGRHYETSSGDAKEFIYKVLGIGVADGIKLAIIPQELADAVKAAYGDRIVYSCIMEDGTTVVTLPPIFERIIKLAGYDRVPHPVAVALLSVWTGIAFPTVRIVSEDSAYRHTVTSTMKAILDPFGIKVSVEAISPSEATEIMRVHFPHRFHNGK